MPRPNEETRACRNGRLLKNSSKYCDLMCECNRKVIFGIAIVTAFVIYVYVALLSSQWLSFSQNVVWKANSTTADYLLSDGLLQKRCYVVTSHLNGNHSEARMKQALTWLRHGTIQSVQRAALKFQHEQSMSVGSFEAEEFYLLLELGGSYARNSENTTELFIKIEPLQGLAYDVDLIERGGITQANMRSLISSNCEVMYFTRIDADDMLDANFFSKIKTISIANSNEIAVVASSVQLELSILKEGEELFCSIWNHSRPWQFSQGQTVVMRHSTWRNYFFPATLFGHHKKVVESIVERAPTMNAYEITIDYLGIYMITKLSGHFQYPTQKCDLKSLAQNIGPDNFKTFEVSLNYLPHLTEFEMRENKHGLTCEKKKNCTITKP